MTPEHHLAYGHEECRHVAHEEEQADHMVGAYCVVHGGAEDVSSHTADQRKYDRGP